MSDKPGHDTTLPFTQRPPSLSAYVVSVGLIALLSLYGSGGQMIQLGQWEHFIALDHSDGPDRGI